MAETVQDLWTALYPDVRAYWNALPDFSVTAYRSTTPASVTVSHNMVRASSAESVGVDPFQELDIITFSRPRITGPNPWLYIHEGLLQVNLYMPEVFDDEDEAFAVFADHVRVMWQGGGFSEDGFSAYGVSMPQQLPAPLPGFSGRFVETNFRFITRPTAVAA